MQLDIRSRHFEITEAIRGHVLGKIGKLDKFLLKIESAHVIFDVQKMAQTCEIVIMGKDLRLSATEQSEDLYVSLDKAISNLERQLARFHEKVREHRVKGRNKESDEV